MHACVLTQVSMNLWAWIHVCGRWVPTDVHVEVRGQSGTRVTNFEMGFLSGLELAGLDWFEWLFSEPQGSTCLYLISDVVATCITIPDILVWDLGIELRSS